MVTRAFKTKKTKLITDPSIFNLKETRLRKVLFETLIPFEKGKGKVDLNYKAGHSIGNDSNSIIVFLFISGKAFIEKDDSKENTFNFEAELEGIFTSKDIIEESLLAEDLAKELSRQLLPLLVDMVKTLILKSSYGAVSLPLSFDLG